MASHRTHRVPAYLLGLAWLCGCGTEPLPEPGLQQACQARFPDACLGWVYAGEQVPVRVQGSGLLQTLDVDLGGDSVTFDEAFELELGGVALRRVELVPGSRPQAGTLFAVIPPTLPVGRHALWVRTPVGLEAELPEAFEVRDPLRVRASLDRSLLAPGERALLSVHVDQLGLGSLESLALTLEATGTGALGLPPAPPAFALGPQAARTLVLPIEGLAPGEFQLSLRVAGRTAEDVAVAADLPRPLSLEIR
ncbi:MAG TPA: hypothetical protein PK668_00415 [Myxococcota bacterium]|nr:hypothetical protein [Myxococcota bacterium]HRY95706.1 hypothetical protein [Myxococcota bacterium]HSA21799.1 hypothetical protein [Myxococcota bacterium]